MTTTESAPTGRYVHVDADARAALLELLSGEIPESLVAFRQRLVESFAVTDDEAWYLERAAEEYGNDDIEIDEGALVAESAEGAFVHAWVWIEGKPSRCSAEGCEIQGEGVQSTPCGSLCAEHLGAHMEDCAICHAEFGDVAP